MPRADRTLASLPARLGGRFVDGLLFIPLAIVLFRARHTHLVRTVGPTGVIHTHLVSHHLSPLVVLLAAAPSAAYEIGMIAWHGQTVGKLIANVRVVDHDGKVPTTGQAVIRWLVIGVPTLVRNVSPPLRILSVFFILDFLWATWDRDRQCLHDKAARTFVVSDIREP